MFTELSGQIERITFTNEDNGYTIAKVKVRGKKDLITVVGNLMAPMPGEILDMQGEWTIHPKFGEQFKVAQFKTKVPATNNEFLNVVSIKSSSKNPKTTAGIVPTIVRMWLKSVTTAAKHASVSIESTCFSA